MKRACRNKYCGNEAAKGRKECHRCRKKKWAENNPMKYTYANLRTNAKRRKKPFEITFDQFKRFVVQTEYMYGKGKTRKALTIDRIEEEKGYVDGNLQVLENETNIRKYLEWKWNGTKMEFTVITSKVTKSNNDETPF